MKRIVCWMLIWAMMMGATAACAEEHECSFIATDQYRNRFVCDENGHTENFERKHACLCGETYYVFIKEKTPFAEHSMVVADSIVDENGETVCIKRCEVCGWEERSSAADEEKITIRRCPHGVGRHGKGWMIPREHQCFGN